MGQWRQYKMTTTNSTWCDNDSQLATTTLCLSPLQSQDLSYAPPLTTPSFASSPNFRSKMEIPMVVGTKSLRGSGLGMDWGYESLWFSFNDGGRLRTWSTSGFDCWGGITGRTRSSSGMMWFEFESSLSGASNRLHFREIGSTGASGPNGLWGGSETGGTVNCQLGSWWYDGNGGGWVTIRRDGGAVATSLSKARVTGLLTRSLWSVVKWSSSWDARGKTRSQSENMTLKMK